MDDPVRSKAMNMHKAMFTLSKPSALPKSSLFHGCQNAPIDHIRQQLLPYQREVFDALRSNGTTNNTAAILGGGDAGKTRLGVQSITGYMGNVSILNEHIERTHLDCANYLRPKPEPTVSKEEGQTSTDDAWGAAQQSINEVTQDTDDHDDLCAPSLTKPSDDGSIVTKERGPIKLIAAHNDTVDGLHRKALHEATRTFT
jgi:hypothetical protein